MTENPWLDLPPNPPYVLPKDRPYVDAFNEEHSGVAEYRFDLDLIPAPFMGNPEANLVLLVRNPGIDAGDAKAHRDPHFAATLRANIQGNPEARAAVGLLNRFRDRPTGEYWRPKFKAVLEHAGSADDLASRVLIVEFVAYRSISYHEIGVTLPSQLYGFDLVRAAVARGATIVFHGPAEWRIAVPELRSYANVVPLGNRRRGSPYISPGNCGRDGFEKVLAAVGYGPSTLGSDWPEDRQTITAVGAMSGDQAPLSRGAVRGQLYEAFWTQLLGRVQREHPDWPSDRPHRKNDVDMRSPVPGTFITCRFTGNGRLSHELYIDSRNARRNMQIFDSLRQQREQLEASYGGPLQWEDLPKARFCRIADYKEGCTIEQVERFDEYVDWFIDAGQRLRAALTAVGSPG